MNNILNILLTNLSINYVNSLPELGEDFKFELVGWYFFISPISGIIKIKIVRNSDAEYLETLSSKRFLGFKILYVIGISNQSEFNTLYSIADNHFLSIQKQAIEIFSHNKKMISAPGIYDFRLVAETFNHVNNDGNKIYYVFDGIDKDVYDLCFSNISETNIDQYLNDPFYTYNYDLEGFIIYKSFLERLDVTNLKLNKVYQCKVDYIDRNLSRKTKQLAITEIFTLGIWIKIKLSR